MSPPRHPDFDEHELAPWEWEEPVSLGLQVALPSFPTEVLSGWQAEFVVELAEAMQVPHDLPAVLVLSATAAAAGGRAVAEVRPGWREPLNLYTAVAMPPGSRKSPVFSRVTAPLTRAEQAAIERAKPLVVEAQTIRKVAEQAAATAAQVAAKADADRDAARDQAVAAARMAEAVAVPVVPRLLADDATPEALASLLVEQRGRVAVLSAEGDIFGMMAGRYNQSGPNLAVYLKGHAGDALRVDRKGRPPEYVERPALTIGVAVQPDVLAKLSDQPDFRGRGLLARFLYAIPEDTVGFRRPGAAPVSERVGDRYDAEMELLATSLADWDDPAVLPFTDEANAAVLDWERRIEPRLGPGGDLSHVREWGAKLAGATVRLAGLLHVADNVRAGWGTTVRAETVVRACWLAEYFVAHALAVFDLMEADRALADARAVLHWAESRSAFTKRDAHRALESRFSKAADLDPVLGVLEDRGWIRHINQPKPGDKGGRPRSPLYEVHPEAQRHNRRNRQNPTGSVTTSASVGSVGSVAGNHR